ncbi:MAG: arginine--tRNA ligase [Anaerolineales bacterium]
MFEHQLADIEQKFADFCQNNSLPAFTPDWKPIPFSGEWGTSVSLFALAAQEARQRGQKINVQARAAELAEQLKNFIGTPEGFSHLEAVKGYLNLYFNTADYAKKVVQTVLAQANSFGRGASKTEKVMVEYAQPNTHHSFHIGHYRNAILGESLARLVEFSGYPVIRACYPGDIGLGVITVIWYYQKFCAGQEPEGIHARGQWLLQLYVEANQLLEAKENETPEETAQRQAYDAERRELYRRWDAGDPEVRALWERTRQWSLDELKDILRQMDIHMDVWFFESQVDDLAKKIVEELIERGLADDERPQGGAVVVHIDQKLGLTKEKYRSNIILRSDGTTLYLTKDLALAKIKFEQYHVERSIYVIDVRQSLHMQQAFAILKLWGFPQAEKCYHLGYGFVSLPEGAMSARRGRLVLYQDVAEEAKQRVLNEIEQKNPEMPHEQRAEVAEKIGLGALAYAMLSVDNNRDIVFDMNQALSFDGRTGPYIQNAYVRANSILKKWQTPIEPAAFDYPLTPHEIELIEQITRFPTAVQQAASEYRPLVMTTYAYELANAFHSFYHAVPVIQAETAAIRSARLSLVQAAKQTLRNALALLGITAPEVM